jgi:NAD(P)-dependent dehydrogenase (short-subunit alcohol dehydrogenase family)
LSLYKTGWTVVLVARRKDALEETQRLLWDTAPQQEGEGEGEDGGRRAVYCLADLSEESAAKKVFDYVRESYGEYGDTMNQ